MARKERQEVDHGKDARLERAKGRNKGQFLCLLTRTSDGAGPDAEFLVVANESCALVTDADVRAWLEEVNYVGTVYPVRFGRGADTTRKSFTRAEQKTFTITAN